MSGDSSMGGRGRVGYVLAILLVVIAVGVGVFLLFRFNRAEGVGGISDYYTFEYGVDAMSELEEANPSVVISANFEYESHDGVVDEYPAIGKYEGMAISGNQSKSFVVEIVDTTPPEFNSFVSEMSYTIGEGNKDALLSNFSASDLSGAVEIGIEGDLDFKSAGDYDIQIYAMDSSRNASTVDCHVTIVGLGEESANSAWEESLRSAESVYNDIQHIADGPEETREYTDERQFGVGYYVLAPSIGLDISVSCVTGSVAYESLAGADFETILYHDSGYYVLCGGLSGIGSLAGGDAVSLYIDGVSTSYVVEGVESFEVVDTATRMEDGSMEMIPVLEGYSFVGRAGNFYLFGYNPVGDVLYVAVCAPSKS